MWALILGLILFLGPHSVRIVAPAWRDGRLAAWGEKRWKLSYTAASVIGLLLIVWGYGQARLDEKSAREGRSLSVQRLRLRCSTSSQKHRAARISPPMNCGCHAACSTCGRPSRA